MYHKLKLKLGNQNFQIWTDFWVSTSVSKPVFLLINAVIYNRCCCFSNYFTATATNKKCTAPSNCKWFSAIFTYSCCGLVLLLIAIAVAHFIFSYNCCNLSYFALQLLYPSFTFHCICCDPVLLFIVVAVAWFYFSL